MNDPHRRGGIKFRQRLGYYLLGLALGLVLVGLIFSARQRRHQAAPPPQQTAPTPPN